MSNQNQLAGQIKKYCTEVIHRLSEKYKFPYEEALNIIFEEKNVPFIAISPYKKAKDEEVNLQLICDHINNRSPCGEKIKASWCQANPGKECFDRIIPHGGRGKKYDLELVWSVQDKRETCEYKGSATKKPIDITKSPWSNAVQGLNGPGNKFSIGIDYAKHFYGALDEIIEYYQIMTAKPSYDEWIKDAFACGAPNTPFVCELSNKSNQGYKGSYLSDTIRIKYNNSFIPSREQLEVLKSEVFTRANEAFGQKDNWLQINGSIKEPDDFEIRWSGQFAIPDIVSIDQFKCKGSDRDINFKLTCSDGQVFTPKLRWGYGQCITNIRLDIK